MIQIKNIQTKQYIVIIVMVLAMLNNFEHSSYVYFTISQKIFPYTWLNWMQSFLVILGIDLFIVIYIMHGRLVEAGIFSVAFYVLNLVYVQILDIRVAEVIFPFLCIYGVFTLALIYEKNKQIINETQLAEITELSENQTLKKQLIDTENELKNMSIVEQKLSDMSGNLNLISTKLSEAELELNKAKLLSDTYKLTIETMYRNKSRSKKIKEIDIENIVHKTLNA